VEAAAEELETTDYNISAFGLELGIALTYALRFLEQALVVEAQMALLQSQYPNAS
jgi:hypothetical protein